MWEVAVLICRFLGICGSFSNGRQAKRSRTVGFSCCLSTVDKVCGLKDPSSSMTILSAKDWSISAGLGVVWKMLRQYPCQQLWELAAVPTGDLYLRLCEPVGYILKSQMSGILDSFAVFAAVVNGNSTIAVC